MKAPLHIPHSRPRFGHSFFKGLARVLESGHVAMGREAEALEKEVSDFLEMPHAAAVDSGTSALMLAVRALKGTRSNFVVGVPAYVCCAVSFAVRAAGAVPRGMDCGPDLRLLPEQVNAMASQLDAVVLVHPFGLVEPLVAETWPCPVIEDIAQGAGGRLHGRPVGSYGDVTIASFYATKPWGGAAGGMILSKDVSIHTAVLAMRYADGAGLDQDYAGNHQLSDIHAAMARTRFAQAEAERERRRHITQKFDAWLRDKAATPVAGLAEGSCFRYIVRMPCDAAGLIDALRASGIDACRPVSAYPDRTLFPGAAQAWESCVSLPLLGDFSSEELQYVKGTLDKCLS